MSPEREAELAQRHAWYVPSALPIDGGCAHGDGWFDVVDRMLAAIENAQPGSGVQLVQIKNKLGLLRVYADGCNPAAAAAIAVAEAESARVCELCGAAGTPRTWPKSARCGSCPDRAG